LWRSWGQLWRAVTLPTTINDLALGAYDLFHCFHCSRGFGGWYERPATLGGRRTCKTWFRGRFHDLVCSVTGSHAALSSEQAKIAAQAASRSR
jgi:hypothetical protein